MVLCEVFRDEKRKPFRLKQKITSTHKQLILT